MVVCLPGKGWPQVQASTQRAAFLTTLPLNQGEQPLPSAHTLYTATIKLYMGPKKQS